MIKSPEAIVQLDNLQFIWPGNVHATLDIDHFSIGQRERVFLKGPSGSGKTTLLSLIAAVLSPQNGRIVVDGISLDTLKGGQKDQFRVDRIGMVFQQFNLLPFLSVQDNVQLPCKFSKQRRATASQSHTITEEANRLLRAMRLPLDDIKDRPVTELSVGQQQRVAVARALIGRPPLIIADEPTSALDSDTRQAFLALLFAEVETAGSALLFVSHDASLAGSFDRSVDLTDINAATDNEHQDSFA